MITKGYTQTLQALPIELICSVYSFLPPLTRLLPLSKRLLYMGKNPILWRYLKLKAVPSPDFARKILRIARQVRQLDLRFVQGVDDRVCGVIGNYGLSLTCLQLDGCERLTDSSLQLLCKP